MVADVTDAAAVILAGGRALRMGGGDKPLRLLAGQPLLTHVLARVAPQAGAVAISANGDPARFAAFGLPVLADPVLADPVLADPVLADPAADYPGPLAGILAGMVWARAAGFALLLSVPGDTPFLPRDLAARLAAARMPAARVAFAASAGRTHPVAGLWPVDLADDLAVALTGPDRSVARFAAHYGVAVAEFAVAAFDPFLNINTPADLAAAELLASGGAGVP
jgi:molybdopterin-guanine dinucleotide biosynthesis protein A